MIKLSTKRTIIFSTLKIQLRFSPVATTVKKGGFTTDFLTGIYIGNIVPSFLSGKERANLRFHEISIYWNYAFKFPKWNVGGNLKFP